MKIEVKNLRIYSSLSRETTCFTCNIAVNGKHAGNAINDGHGGMTNVDIDREILGQVEAYCKSLPPIKYPASEGMESFEVAMDLENYVDNIVNTEVEKKEANRFQKKMVKDMEKYILSGVPGKLEYSIWKIKTNNVPLSQIPADLLGKVVANITAKLNPGEVILNTNLRHA